jgi:hypothetical protein|tara:strand:+ start:2496 stop:3167 length:672 start_codon:yes stop_codon:yes gene_type:complete
MSFQNNKYSVIKKAISKEMADFIYKYFLLKRQTIRTLLDTGYISPFTHYLGTWSDEQVPNTYSHYADTAMEVLLAGLLPLMKKETNLNLIPTYSYARIYKKGDILKRHKDRPSCEISTTLNLGGDPWPIYLSPNENVGIAEVEGGEKGITASSNAKGIKIDLNPGDMLIYSGCVLEHWREKFEGDDCGQVFLHYNNVDTQGLNNKFDGRLHLGLPADLKINNE